MQVKDKAGRVLLEYEGELRYAVSATAPNLAYADLRGADLTGAELSDATLDNADLSGAELYWAILFRASLKNANLEGVDLRGADLKAAELSGANLRNANLGLDNLGGATQLQGAKLAVASLDGTITTGAEYDGTTEFPVGFNADEHGMIRVG